MTILLNNGNRVEFQITKATGIWGTTLQRRSTKITLKYSLVPQEIPKLGIYQARIAAGNLRMKWRFLEVMQFWGNIRVLTHAEV